MSQQVEPSMNGLGKHYAQGVPLVLKLHNKIIYSIILSNHKINYTFVFKTMNKTFFISGQMIQDKISNIFTQNLKAGAI